MAYVEGFIVAVPAANKDAYRKHASEAWPLFQEFGARRMVEAWGDDVPEGKLTDFRRAVKAKDDEAVVFSWFEYPDKETRDAANARMREDPRMKDMGANMPFDGMRMVYGGFSTLLDQGDGGPAGYIDGMLAPVSAEGEEAYREFARSSGAIFLSQGVTRSVDAWGDDLPDGKVTDFKGAVQAGGDETVVFAWMEWPSKEARDDAWKVLMEDPEMKKMDMPFDGKRMIYGGFKPIVDVGTPVRERIAEPA